MQHDFLSDKFAHKSGEKSFVNDANLVPEQRPHKAVKPYVKVSANEEHISRQHRTQDAHGSCVPATEALEV